MKAPRPLVVLGVAASVFGAGCAAATGPAVPEALPPVPVRAGSADTVAGAIQWSSNRPLTWADFAGVPQLRGRTAAVTTYVLWWKADCGRDGFAFEVVSGFVRERSWVKPSVLSRYEESRRALEHEQTHFDLSEVHARRMRQALGRLRRPCEMTEEELYDAVSPIVLDDQRAQATYDRETAHGLDRLQQAAWDENVARQLTSLERYSGTVPLPVSGSGGR